MEYEKQKKNLTAKILRKRRLLWLVWCVLTVVLSTFGILYQVAKSIPGSLQAGKILSLALKACIGATQGLAGNFIVPYLAGRITWQKHVFTTVSGLLMNCVIPIVVIIYLDAGLHCKASMTPHLFELHCGVESCESCNMRGEEFDLWRRVRLNNDNVFFLFLLLSSPPPLLGRILLGCSRRRGRYL